MVRSLVLVYQGALQFVSPSAAAWVQGRPTEHKYSATVVNGHSKLRDIASSQLRKGRLDVLQLQADGASLVCGARGRIKDDMHYPWACGAADDAVRLYLLRHAVGHAIDSGDEADDRLTTRAFKRRVRPAGENARENAAPSRHCDRFPSDARRPRRPPHASDTIP